MTTKELGVWTADSSALVLIDYQNEMFEVIRSETNAELVELNIRMLAKAAKAFNMPIVLSTVGVGYGIAVCVHRRLSKTFLSSRRRGAQRFLLLIRPSPGLVTPRRVLMPIWS